MEPISLDGTPIPLGGEFWTVGIGGPVRHRLLFVMHYGHERMLVDESATPFHTSHCHPTSERAVAVERSRAEWNCCYHREQLALAEKTLAAIDAAAAPVAVTEDDGEPDGPSVVVIGVNGEVRRVPQSETPEF